MIKRKQAFCPFFLPKMTVLLKQMFISSVNDSYLSLCAFFASVHSAYPVVNH